MVFIKEISPSFGAWTQIFLLINIIMVLCVTYDPPSPKVKGSWVTVTVNEDQNDETDEEFTVLYNPNPELCRRASTPG